MVWHIILGYSNSGGTTEEDSETNACLAVPGKTIFAIE